MLWMASQQAAASMSAVMSKQLPSQTMQMNCDHGESSQMSSDMSHHGEQLNNHDQMQPGSPCCQLSCQCSISGGPAMPVSVPGAVFTSHSLTHEVNYFMAVPHPPENTLFRPPISV